MSDSRSFYYQQKFFSNNGFFVTSPDFPGFGGSAPLTAAWSVGDYADWLGDFIAARNLFGAHIMAHSFGARVAIKLLSKGNVAGKVVIVGGGSVGTNACKIAVGMGADVTVMDVNIHRLEYLDDIFGSRIQTLYSNDVNIENALKTADLVVGSVLIPGKKAPKVIKRSYLREMRPGSVIVDVAVDQGGCCETTHMTYHDDPIYKVDGIVHYCVGNMPGAVPRTSTIALTNATLSFGLTLAENGLEAACRKDERLYSAVNTYDGKLTCKNVADSFKMEYTDIHDCF